MNSQNGLSRSELYTLGIGLVIIIILIFLGGKLTSPPRGTYINPMDQSQSSQQSSSIPSQSQQAAAAFQAIPANTKNISSDSNVQIYDTKVGTGAAVKAGQTVTVNYTGMFQDGTKFDASADHGQPLQTILDTNHIIKGWVVGLQGMKVGGTRRLIISPSYGYGSQAQGPIPANSTLIFDVELLGVK